MCWFSDCGMTRRRLVSWSLGSNLSQLQPSVWRSNLAGKTSGDSAHRPLITAALLVGWFNIASSWICASFVICRTPIRIFGLDQRSWIEGYWSTHLVWSSGFYSVETPQRRCSSLMTAINMTHWYFTGYYMPNHRTESGTPTWLSIIESKYSSSGS